MSGNGNNNATPKINVRAGNEEYNGKSEEELRTLLDTKKTELEGVVYPNNQQGMPAYHSERAGIFTAMARIYRKLVMTEAADLAELSAKTENKASASWDKNLSGWSNSDGSEGGGKKRRLRKSRRRSTSRKA
jgi:hypothetical protein